MYHPDNSGPCKCSWESYQENVETKGYPKTTYYGDTPMTNASIKRTLFKLSYSSIPQYQHGPTLPKNSEIIPLNK